MAIKCASNDGKPEVLNSCDTKKRNKDHVQEEVDPAIDSIDNGGHDGATG